MVEVTQTDVVYDLGSGDGRLLFRALEKGASKVVGIDLDAKLIHEARETARHKNVVDRADFIEADVMDVDLSKATIVFCYLFPSASEALKPKFEAELKPGARVVMEMFDVPGWKPQNSKFTRGKTFYLYLMPPEKEKETYRDYNIF